MSEQQTLTFRTIDGRTIKGVVKNPKATLGAVASRIAGAVGLAGSFEMVQSETGLTLDPHTRLEELPEGDITMASELTPAG